MLFLFLTLSVRSWFEASQGHRGWEGWEEGCQSRFSLPITCLPSGAGSFFLRQSSLPLCVSSAKLVPITCHIFPP